MSDVGARIRAVKKPCDTCHQELPLADFSVKRAARGGLQGRCKACWRLDYEANREERKRVAAKNARASLARHRVRVAAYLREHPCVDCGESDIRCLDFDHRDPTQKSMNVSAMVFLHVAWKRIEAEIAKCDVRCANCHRKRTSEVQADWRQRQWVFETDAASRQAGLRLRAVLGSAAAT
jgi:hypothetical protein